MHEESAKGDDLGSLRARAAAVGLALDDERLARLAQAMPGVEAMVAAMERVAIDPSDLALEAFDPAWPGKGRVR